MELNLIDEEEEKSITDVGQTAPNFSLLDESGQDWTLKNQKGSVTVLIFYPRNETLVCTKQLCSIRDNWHKYSATKANIVGVSAGTTGEHQIFKSKYQLPMPLLADSQKKITTLYCNHIFYPVNFTRAIFVIDAKGTIRYRKIMLRTFRPNDEQILNEIYAARAEMIYENRD